MEKMKLKKGQVSIFIILGILIVVVLLLLFSRDAGFDTIFAKQSPYQEIEGCAQTAIQEGLDILMLQGGVIESENYFMYEGKKIDYVCYSENEYENCIMQKPILTNTIRDELEEYSTPKIKSCLSSVKNDLERKGYSVVMRDPEIVIELVPDNVLVDMNLGLRIEKTGVESFDHIRTGIKSKIYNFALITSSISQWETRYGDSETLNYMLYYPSLKWGRKNRAMGQQFIF